MIRCDGTDLKSNTTLDKLAKEEVLRRALFYRAECFTKGLGQNEN